MADDPDNVAEPWDDSDGPGPDDGDNYAPDTSVPGLGCSFCGSNLGDCMSPGDHCPIAKKMFAPKPAPVAAHVPIQDFATPRSDEGGVWVTYFNDPEMPEGLTEVRVHPDELTALRTAVQYARKAQFLKWGEEL